MKTIMRLRLTTELRIKLNDYVYHIRQHGFNIVFNECVDILEHILANSVVKTMENNKDFVKFDNRYKYITLSMPDITTEPGISYYDKNNKRFQNKVNAILGYMVKNSLSEMLEVLLYKKFIVEYNKLEEVANAVDELFKVVNNYHKYDDEAVLFIYNRLVFLGLIRVNSNNDPIMNRGKFIVLEGVDGIGKSTILDSIQKTYTNIFITRQPGGTDIGEQIRNILLSNDNIDMDNFTELLLYVAARHQHIKQVIEPILDTGVDVISDRYYYSSIIYQKDILKMINTFNIKFLFNDIVIPDLVISLYTDNIQSIKNELTKKNQDRLEVNMWNELEEVNLMYKLLHANKLIANIEGVNTTKNIKCINYTNRDINNTMEAIDNVLSKQNREWI